MENPPLVEGGHRRNMSDDCDVIIHDTEDGVVLVIENRDSIAYTMRFDFQQSENLALECPDDVDHPSAMKVNIVVEPGTARNLCHLVIQDMENADSFEMRYKVQCLVKNPKTGELEEVTPPPPKPQPERHADPAANSATQQEAADGEEERKEITKTLFIVIRDTDTGYKLLFDNLEKVNDYHCTVNMSNSENLQLTCLNGATASGDLECKFVSRPGVHEFAKLDVKDLSLGTCALSYKVLQRLDTGNEDAAKKKAEEEAAAKKAEEEAAKKKAAEDAAKKKADEEAAAKKKAEEELAAKKKAEEDAARKKAEEEEAERKRAEAEAAAKKKAEEEAAAKKRAEEDAARLKAEEEEWRKKWLIERLEKMYALEIQFRRKIEVEWLGKWVLIERQRRESMCNLCRGLLKEGQETKQYKEYHLHQACYDKAPKCDFCSEILVGGYVVAKGDLGSGTKLHRECIQGYKESSRPACAKCGNKIMDPAWATVAEKTYHKSCAPGQ